MGLWAVQEAASGLHKAAREGCGRPSVGDVAECLHEEGNHPRSGGAEDGSGPLQVTALPVVLIGWALIG